jgi:hypothetical protein
MRSFKSKLGSMRARVVVAVFGLVCSLASMSAVFVVFASASDELHPAQAKMKAAASASEVASKVPVKRVRG